MPHGFTSANPDALAAFNVYSIMGNRKSAIRNADEIGAPGSNAEFLWRGERLALQLPGRHH